MSESTNPNIATPEQLAEIEKDCKWPGRMRDLLLSHKELEKQVAELTQFREHCERPRNLDRAQCCDPVIDGELGALLRERDQLKRQLTTITSQRDAAVKALEELAELDDSSGNYHLEAYDTYAAFDEPGSVQLARAALAKIRGKS